MVSSGLLRRVALVRTDVRRLLVAACVPSSPILSPWWRRRQVPLKHRFLQEPHGVTTQKTPFFLLLVTANMFPSSLILATLIMEAIHSSETLVLTRAAWCNIPEDSILYSHRCENLKMIRLLLPKNVYVNSNSMAPCAEIVPSLKQSQRCATNHAIIPPASISVQILLFTCSPQLILAKISRIWIKLDIFPPRILICYQFRK
jgi:hypothetical protein